MHRNKRIAFGDAEDDALEEQLLVVGNETHVGSESQVALVVHVERSPQVLIGHGESLLSVGGVELLITQLLQRLSLTADGLMFEGDVGLKLIKLWVSGFVAHQE